MHALFTSWHALTLHPASEVRHLDFVGLGMPAADNGVAVVQTAVPDPQQSDGEQGTSAFETRLHLAASSSLRIVFHNSLRSCSLTGWFSRPSERLSVDMSRAETIMKKVVSGCVCVIGMIDACRYMLKVRTNPLREEVGGMSAATHKVHWGRWRVRKCTRMASPVAM